MADAPYDAEEWRSIPNFPSYAVSNLGRVMRLRGNNGAKAGHILSQCVRKKGYVKVTLSEGGVYFTRDVHRLVAFAFLGAPPSEDHEVAHDDGIRHHNNASNLFWKTQIENNGDKYRHGTQPLGEGHHMTTLTTEQVISIRLERAAGASFTKLGRKYGCDPQTIANIVRRFTWKHVA